MSKIAAGLLSVVLLAGCGQGASESASDTAIVGGSRVSESNSITKSTVALVTPDAQVFCTGSLVTKRLVVTASHCIEGYDEEQLFVAFGVVAEDGTVTNDRLRVARSYTQHEDYDTAAMDEEDASRPPNDIALIALSEDAPDNYKPVAVARLSDDLHDDETLTLAGFGLTHWLSGSTGVLRKVDVKLTNLAHTAKEIHFGGRPGKSACMGDSGGPAFVKRNGKLVLVGVTSRGDSHCGGEGIYTDIRHFVGWINSRATSL